MQRQTAKKGRAIPERIAISDYQPGSTNGMIDKPGSMFITDAFYFILFLGAVFSCAAVNIKRAGVSGWSKDIALVTVSASIIVIYLIHPTGAHPLELSPLYLALAPN